MTVSNDGKYGRPVSPAQRAAKRWRRLVTGSAVVTALLLGASGPAVWRLYNPELDLSNTPELELDVWARRRELALTWRACDDRDQDYDGWHLCRASIAGAPAMEIWCAGDGTPGLSGCTFGLMPQRSADWRPWHSSELERLAGGADRAHALETMATFNHPDPDDKPKTPTPTPGMPPLGTPPGPGDIPPEQGGGMMGGSHQGATPSNTGTGLREPDDPSKPSPK